MAFRCYLFRHVRTCRHRYRAVCAVVAVPRGVLILPMMKTLAKFSLPALLLANLLVTGCTTPTPYQPYIDSVKHAGESVGGYYEVPMGNNTYMVTFVGNDVTIQDDSVNYALMRSAELTMLMGFDYFVIVSGDSSQVSSTGYVSVGNSLVPYTLTTPSTKNIVAMFKEKPAESFSYHAETVFNSLRAAYGLDTE